ncbi:hypothetical protein BYT27DRAFT_7265693 [Phlegmacium glaucopus]|nr:hypothetical protein BYT27DRAFT_7265693 [Phlegmacium glaucopus]
MINGLDFSNPTQLLLNVIRLAGVDMLAPAGSFKGNEEFSLGLVSATGEISRTYKITAGDPSNRGGSLSLDADRAPPEGSTVQFLHHPFTAPVQLPPNLLHCSSESSSNLPLKQLKETFAFLSVPEPTSDASHNFNLDLKVDSTAALVLPHIFLSPSVTGFILSRPTVSASSSAPKVPQGASHPIEVVQVADIPDVQQQHRLQKSESPWKCSLPGGLSVLEWQ